MAEQSSSIANILKTLNDNTERLGNEVSHLSDAVLQSKVFSRALAVLIVLNFALSAVTGYAVVKTNNTEDVLRTNCMNANEVREATRNVWDFILGYELADPNNNPAETTMSEMILPYIHKAWADRDCNDLDRKYPLPDPPKIPGRLVAE